jgi:hypothetical protein
MTSHQHTSLDSNLLYSPGRLKIYRYPVRSFSTITNDYGSLLPILKIVEHKKK